MKVIAVQKQFPAKSWMTSEDASMIKQRFFIEHLPPLKSIGEREITDNQILQTQPKLHSTSLFPPIIRSVPARPLITNDDKDSPPSSIAQSSIAHELDQRYHARNSILSMASRYSPALNNRAKRTSLYDHVGPKIDTGLAPRFGSITRTEHEAHRLGPIRPLKWSSLRQELERDLQIRAQTKRLQFNSGITFTKQLTTLGDLVRLKVKSHVAAAMGFVEERYKIVVHLTVFPTDAVGLHVASRCLWNPLTDNSITIRMHGIDCDVLIVLFLCYTDLGGI